jgi:hypothetical protein
LQAATNELQANGRQDVTWGIILLTDGAANVAPTTTTTTSTTVSDDTGWEECDSQNRVNSGSGDNNGFENDASDSCDSDNDRADDNDSGTGTSTSCTSSQKDRHTFWDFDLRDEINNGATITGVEVRVEAYATTTATTRRMCVDISVNGGSSWTALGQINLSGTSEQTYTLGNSTNVAGNGWNRDHFSDSNFRVRITNVSNSGSMDFRLDSVQAKTHFTYVNTNTTTVYDNNLGPCDWAGTQANIAKSLGIEIFAIGWGVSSDDECDNDLPSSPYYNWDADDFLASLATDAEHFYNEPKSADLEPIFNSIGAQLTSGSKLVE